jgi:hypothetical protein
LSLGYDFNQTAFSQNFKFSHLKTQAYFKPNKILLTSATPLLQMIGIVDIVVINDNGFHFCREPTIIDTVM